MPSLVLGFALGKSQDPSLSRARPGNLWLAGRKSCLYPTVLSPEVPGHYVQATVVTREERMAALTPQQWEVVSAGQVDPLRSPLEGPGPCLGQASRIRVVH